MYVVLSRLPARIYNSNVGLLIGRFGNYHVHMWYFFLRFFRTYFSERGYSALSHVHTSCLYFITRAPTSFAGTVVYSKPWKGCPDPRGSHSGSVIGNSLLVFGGYGGPGFSRRDFNDVYVSTGAMYSNLSTWSTINTWYPTAGIPGIQPGHTHERKQEPRKPETNIISLGSEYRA